MTIAEPKPRYEWVDIARGYGIILVVIGHACGGIMDSPVAQKSPALNWIFYTIYSFHMPLFFVLAGLFIKDRVAKKPKELAKNAFLKILKPYFIWSVIQVTIIFAMASVVTTPIEQPIWQVYLSILWSPPSQFWFLYVLFILQMLSLLILPRAGALAFLGCMILLKLLSPTSLNVGAATGFLYANGIFFALGILAGPRLMTSRLLFRYPLGLAVIFAVAWVGVLAISHYITQALKGADYITALGASDIANIKDTTPVYLLASVLGTAAVLCLSAARHPGIGHILTYLGKCSMAIFLIHVIVVSGLRILVLKFAPDMNPLILLAVITIGGIIVPVIALEASKRVKLDKVLGLT